MASIPLGDILAFNGERRGPDTWCLRQDDRVLSWRDLDAAATRRAHAFKARGVTKGDTVTLALDNDIPFFEVIFALWKLGAMPHVISHRLPQREMADILEIARPKLVLAHDADVQRAFGAVGDDFGVDGPSEPIQTEVAPHWRALSSGGSTGRPKIIVAHNPGEHDPDMPTLNMPRDDVMLNPGPLYHSVPFTVATGALFRGNGLVNMHAFDPEQVLALIAAHRVSWVIMVPTMMHRIWRLPAETRAQYDLSSLGSVWHVAAPMPVWLKEEWINWLGAPRIWELYGGTESQGFAIINGADWLNHPGSVGKPFRCTMRVVGEDGNDVPTGEVGEIYMKSDVGQTYHYLGAQARALDGGWESLGDFGYFDADGFLYIADRRTDLILSGGRNIYPAEVEGALMQHPDVEGAVAIGLPDDDMGARVHAIVRLAPRARGTLDGDTLHAFLADRLARYKLPRTYEFTEAQLRDEAGKVRRSALRSARLPA